MRTVLHVLARCRQLAVAALATLLASPAAHAGERTVMDIHLHDIKIALIDLDPLDGIAPAVTWGAQALYSTLALTDGALNETRVLHEAGAMALAGPHIAASTQAGADSWRISSSGDPRAGYMAGAYTAAIASIDFVLAPHTAMLVSAVADLHAENHAPDAYLWRSVSLTGSLFRNVDGVQTWARFEDRRENLAPMSERYRLAGALHAGDNASAGTLTLSAATSFVFFHQATPVPEPAHCAMLLAGLGVLAGARRQRRAGAGKTGTRAY
ncbi:PEP-CTERM sorting domain-containing protein [Massilia sp. CCM 8733]|uniref:PEP-CTERM sorting domain-containing protein n=1 Tax=Massilia mucilaginosa TaxID=2609282 RepID=A0ABX0NSI1_9BURK|nr:PEP-CTERM sorting domain-containing protein [Massilia mucilaginosa]NHZ89655.1 PEP-CTERM sorting domain-containing protein [Massilia mucilaginosa]